MDGPALWTSDKRFVAVVEMLELFGFLVGGPEHPLAVLVGEGVAVGEEDLGKLGEEEFEVELGVVFLSLSPLY